MFQTSLHNAEIIIEGYEDILSYHKQMFIKQYYIIVDLIY